MSSILDPLAARYATWLGLPAAATADTGDEDPDEVRAMPVILRIERAEPPSRTALLEAAAAAAVAVCLDPRTEPEGEWHPDVSAWMDGRIRKVTRRARGAHWDAVQSLPGITSEVDGAQVRALVPVRVADTPKEVTRLQISGSELEPDDPPPPPPGAPILWLNPHIQISAGKAAAQVGHATMLLAALLPPDLRSQWSTKDYRCSVRTPTTAHWTTLAPAPDPAAAWHTRGLIAVRDAGFTEIAPGTITVIAQWMP
jgi:peptidyl-tRNA hydrolase